MIPIMALHFTQRRTFYNVLKGPRWSGPLFLLGHPSDNLPAHSTPTTLAVVPEKCHAALMAFALHKSTLSRYLI